MNYTDDFLDQLATKSIINFRSFGARYGKIVLNNFNPNDPAHLALHKLAKVVELTYKYPVYINCNLLQYLYNKNKLHCKWSLKDEHFPTCDEFINFTSLEIGEEPYITMYERFYGNV